MKEKWYRAATYESYERLKKMCIYRRYRRDRGRFTIMELLKIISKDDTPFESFFRYDKETPEKLIPYGRDEECLIDRDYTFYVYLKMLLSEIGDLSGILFISVTGHEGPVAAALTEAGVPLCWQLSLEDDDTQFAQKRIFNQLQDYSKILFGDYKLNHKSMGLILEPSHTTEKTMDLSLLPPVHVLKKMGIKKCIILTESFFKKSDKRGCHAILSYISELEKEGITPIFFGIGDRDGKYADFHYSNTELMSPDDYIINFVQSITPKK